MPMTLQQIRKKYPQYSDMSDTHLLDAMHSKYYSDMPKEDFYQKMGTQAPAEGLIGQVREAGGVMPYAKEVGRQAAAIPLGAAQEVGRMFGSEAAKLGIGGLAGGLIPGQVPQPAAGTEAPARTGRALADIGVYTGATALGGGAGEAAAIPGWIGRTIGAGGAGYGIAGKSGAAMGLLGQPVAELAAPIARGIGKLATRISPNRYAKEILKRLPKYSSGEDILGELSEGKNLPENARSAARNIRDSYKARSTQNAINFDTIKEAAGKGEMPTNNYSEYTNSEISPVKNYPSLTKQAHNEFIKNPNYENAHKLQSVLYKGGKALKKAPTSDIVKHDLGNRFFAARDNLINDTNNHLNTIDPTENLSKQYENARKFHREEIIPYEENKLIRNIARGKVKNPGNMTTIFKSPEENVRKVIGDVGSALKDKIIYNDLQKSMRGKFTDEKLIKSFDALEAKELGEHVSPKLDEQMNKLRQKSAVDELLKGAGKKPTAKTLSKSFEKLEKNKRDDQLPSSLQDQLDRLRTRVKTRKAIKKTALWGAGVTGASALGYGGLKLGRFL